MQAFRPVPSVHHRPARFRLRASSAAAALALAGMSQLAMADVCSFSSGNYSVSGCLTTLGSGDSLSIIGGSYKYLDVALTTTAGGAIDASDNLYFATGNTINNGGNFRFLNDSSLFDNGASGVFVNTGTLSKVAGGGDSTIGISGFVNNGGTINAQTGRIIFNSGATFNAGSSFTGPGTVLVSGGASFSGAFSSDGSLVLGGGTYTGSGTTPATLSSGSLQLNSGTLAGSWQTASGTTVNIVGGSYKYVGGTLSNAGTLVASDNLYFNNGTTLTNNGSYQFTNDSNLFNNDGPGSFVNNGTLAKVGGGGDSHVSVSGFSNSGTGVIDVQTGRMLFDNGGQFASGTRITGAGQVLVTNGASFSGALSTANNLYLTGGTITANNVVATGDVYWTAGTLSGTWENTGGSTLRVDGGSYKYVAGTLTNAGTMTTTDNLYFNAGSTLVNNSSYQFTNDAGLYNNDGPGSFINNGTLAKVGGAGDSHIGISGFSNGDTGIIDVQTGRMIFDSGASFSSGTRITGAGQVLVTRGASFSGALSTADNLYLSGGTITGNNVVATGDVHWTSDTMAGTWQTASGSTLYVDGGSYKYVGGTLTNAGTMTATDNLYFDDGNTLVNTGSYQFLNDAGLYNNGGAGSFVNKGTLAKIAGGGDTHVSVSGFSNASTGVIDVQTGRMVFDNGAQFASGSRITGAGQVLVTNGATFNGTLSTGSNLYLSGGTITANNVVATGDAHWTSSTMTGAWQSASGSTLYVEGGSYKYAAGLTLAGRTSATDNLYAYGSGALTNNGRYEFANDSGIYGGGDLVNTGSIVKTAGGGTSDLSGVALQNLGTLEAQTGTLRLPDNFTNAGTLMGVATIQANGTLTNNGHIAPGSAAATGTLTLASNLVQGPLGVLDIRLSSAAASDFLQVAGTAAIDGSTLALSCFSCMLQQGDTYLLMSSSGALTGTFANVTTSGFGNGFEYTLDYSHANEVWLDVTQVGAVPEPSSYAMLLAGFGVIGWLTRRRKKLA
ncbi:PEP-CTERM sorting domain-containing protein [Paucibacter sp. R3-3]|uniref:PEP-CTERM sorting domain-containing protein n=1 Tax=Roseateles agri TaxID=3098619 RepID=A0ABU5DRD5_9BURK|nr:PEP-CTERM sorting domain-containing protein [Paucibacter sp. R3-3]MDY0748881.1 PEP-CTERM sorting domain-containing protein [Paucibacter sp. R3-3]